MKTKSVLIILIVLVLTLLVWGSYKSKDSYKEKNQNEDQTQMMNENMNSESMMENTEEENMMMQDGDTSMMQNSGSYEAYTPTKLAKAEDGDVVLFFRASWCPTCKTLDKNIKENLGSIPNSLTILDVDYDNSTELKRKYGVTYQHTLVQVDKDGNMIKKWSGSPTLQSLVNEVI